MAEDLRAIVPALDGCRAVVIGDVMIDEYLRGDVSRISPEAPVPVLELRSTEHRLGGAANAAANIRALGGETTLIGVVGRDDTATILGERLRASGIMRELVTDPDRPTSKKTRLVAQQQQIVRIDHEKRHAISAQITHDLKRTIDRVVPTAQVCVLSDYAKGVITHEIAQHAIEVARRSNIPVVVDPKQRDLRVYAGATVLTPNLAELDAAAPGMAVEAAAAHLLLQLGGTALLVTRSADGMSLFRTGRPEFHVPAIAKEVFDVTGAGDTVVATLALALGAGITFELAIELASRAAAISVGKRGTSTVTVAELLAAL